MGTATKQKPPFLSQYLMEKAQPFSIYPLVARKEAATVRPTIEKFTRHFAEWRKTFLRAAPEPAAVDLFAQPSLLNQLFCWDLLRAVPDMVKRTRALRGLTLARPSNPESLVYLRESANCYIQGLFQASIALSRAAAEAAMFVRVAQGVAAQAAKDEMFGGLLSRYGRRFLKPNGLRAAERVRDRAKEVLHERRVVGDDVALSVLEDARTVVMELSA